MEEQLDTNLEKSSIVWMYTQDINETKRYIIMFSCGTKLETTELHFNLILKMFQEMDKPVYKYFDFSDCEYKFIKQ